MCAPPCAPYIASSFFLLNHQHAPESLRRCYSRGDLKRLDVFKVRFGPFARYGFIPFGGRSTAIKLSTGDVWVLASTPLTVDTKETLDKMGPVKYIMAGDFVHHLFLGEFKKAYPQAKVIGVDGLGAKKKAEGLTMDGEYGKDPADTRYGFEDEIKSCYFSGFQNKDVAFCHVSSKSLIVADLFFNLPPNEQYSKSKPPFKLPFMGTLNWHSSILKSMLYSLGKDKECVISLPVVID
ncbi:hypothetical protein D9758_009194 [Tetrapyrgos nigripes]|uniref:Uncharacterized protein n=1 Tax=Tetrapyrgos nigripes TaxID=182062 RepID=A0A8H5FWW0_9AGAR|nr:hypothetical protein D9758_009194 [Tetrapyrgos nigripes]